MSGRFTRSWSEAGASDARPLLRASSPLKTEKQPRTNTENWYSERGHFNSLILMRSHCEGVCMSSPHGISAAEPIEL